MALEFTNAAGQRFAIDGLNDEMALSYVQAWIAAGRPFGRKGMKWMELLFGVKVSFLSDPRYLEDGTPVVYCDGY